MFDCHVRQRNHIKSGCVMRSAKVYPNTWTLAGNYRPNLCKAIMEMMPNAFAH